MKVDLARGRRDQAKAKGGTNRIQDCIQNPPPSPTPHHRSVARHRISDKYRNSRPRPLPTPRRATHTPARPRTVCPSIGPHCTRYTPPPNPHNRAQPPSAYALARSQPQLGARPRSQARSATTGRPAAPLCGPGRATPNANAARTVPRRSGEPLNSRSAPEHSPTHHSSLGIPVSSAGTSRIQARAHCRPTRIRAARWHFRAVLRAQPPTVRVISAPLPIVPAAATGHTRNDLSQTHEDGAAHHGRAIA